MGLTSRPDSLASRDLPFCECGCGERVTKPWNRFISNHHSHLSGISHPLYGNK